MTTQGPGSKLQRLRLALRRPIILRRYASPHCVTTIELRQRLPVLIWLAALAWYIAAPGEVTAVLAAALTGLLLLSGLWARSLARGVAAQRALHYAAVQVGDELEERLVLDNLSRLPVLWAEFVDRSNLPGYAVSSVRAVDGLASLRWRARATCTRRGVFTLGPWELRLGDPFGLLLVRQLYSLRQELVVYPPLAPLPAALQPHTSQVGDQRPLRQPLRADSLTALTTRAYAPGDSLHHIHWPATARHDQLHTRLFEPEATSTIWLVLDLDAAAHVTLPAADGPQSDSTEELMVLLAASLADHLLRRRLAVGLLAAPRPESPVVIRPRRGTWHLWDLLRALAPLHAAGLWPLREALARLAAGARLSASDRLVVITPTLDTTWPGGLRLRAGRAGQVDCMLIDPGSFGAAASAQACVPALAAQGIAARVVRRGDLQPLSGAYGELRRWDFITLATGRVVARHTPRLND